MTCNETVIGQRSIPARLPVEDRSGSSTAFGADPAFYQTLSRLPGVLPVLNKEVVRMAVRFGKAIGAGSRIVRCLRAGTTIPSICPKATRSSQYELPVVGKGAVEITLEDGSRQTCRCDRAHLEEDAGKSFTKISTA